ncbi:MAG: hypothetical protein HZB71_07585 [Betaproteobacteria bacterium]|nr:hypothetical protein [Betaproteobacteria bacterium]
MPDPHKDLAPIIEPPFPPVPVAEFPWLPATSLVLLALLALGLWLWRRGATRRALRRLAHAPDPIAAAHALARLSVQIAPPMPQTWKRELERLRFGPPADDGASTLARLCEAALDASPRALPLCTRGKEGDLTPADASPPFSKGGDAPR